MLPVASTTMNSDFLGYANSAAEALQLIGAWAATLPAETTPLFTVTGVTIGTTRWNRAIDGASIGEAYIPTVEWG